jgi:hypothetical protein
VNAIDVFGRIYDAPDVVRLRALTWGIPKVLPIASGLKIRVREASLERSVTTMPLSRRSRNHIGSVYLGALMVQAEITMATLAYNLCRPPQFRILVKRNEAEFPARADGTVTATFAPDAEERAGLELMRRLNNDKGETWTTVKLESEGKTAGIVRFLISVKHKS